MRLLPLLVCGALLAAPLLVAQSAAPAPAPVPTFRSTSTLVFLDVTVLDRSETPVTHGLTRDDFTITEDNKPQRIFSFEAPEEHLLDKHSTSENPDGHAPVTIFVLDLLNCSFEESAYLRYEAHAYFLAQPRQLAAPAELMVVGNNSLQLLQGYTRSREDLLYALDHLPASLPFKHMNGAFYAERFSQSVQALQQIAIQNRALQGRKNIVWLGHGGPAIRTALLEPGTVERLKQYIHQTTNMLVDSRISLFIIYPGLDVGFTNFTPDTMSAQANLGNSDPFAGDINFGLLVDATGGQLFFNRNDVDFAISRSQQLGSQYYTLTYQPPEGPDDGHFRRVRIALRNPKLHILTKAGYFAPDTKIYTDPGQQLVSNLAIASTANIPFSAIPFTIDKLIRHPDSRSAQLTAHVRGSELHWEPTEDGQFKTALIFAVVSLTDTRDLLASRLERGEFTAVTADRARWANRTFPITMTVATPRRTNSIRVLVEADPEARIGSVDIDRKRIEAAPAEPTPKPQLSSRPETTPTH